MNFFLSMIEDVTCAISERSEQVADIISERMDFGKKIFFNIILYFLTSTYPLIALICFLSDSTIINIAVQQSMTFPHTISPTSFVKSAVLACTL